MVFVAEVDFQGFEGVVGDEAEEFDQPHHHAFVEVRQAAAPERLTQEDPLALLEQFGPCRVGEQPLVAERPVQPFAKGGAGEKQILQHLALVDGHVLAQMQAHMLVVGNLRQRLPEPFLAIVGRAQIRHVQYGRVQAQFGQYRVGINAGVEHGPVGHA